MGKRRFKNRKNRDEIRQNKSQCRQLNRLKTRHREAKPNKKEFQLSPTEKRELSIFVKNLSSINLTDAQISALSKGLKHIPTPKKPSRSDLIQDFSLYQRRMRIRYIMRHKKSSKKCYKFKLPSEWTPADSENNTLENYLEMTKRLICHLRFEPQEYNMKPIERKALNELKNNTDIVIKKMDKGRGVTIMNRHDYVQVGLQHLDTHHYELISEDPTISTANTIYNILEELNDQEYIDDDTFIFLNPFSHEIKLSEMYFLPKLHKPKPENAPFEARPILSGVNSATYTISKFIDYFLAPIAESQSTYIRDSTDVITKLQKLTLPKNALLATIDVKAMYTNINHDMAINAATHAYDTRRVQYDLKPIPTKYLTALLTIILENNAFKFDGLYFKQLIGLAMGSPCSVSVANIALHPLEKTFLENATNIICFYRYIDDIILISSGTRELLEKQITMLNNLHPDLKFTADISDSTIDFLDITIYKGTNFHTTGKLSTKIYTKLCDTFQYLSPKSFHTESVFRAFIYGEFLRILRNTSEQDEFTKRCEFFKDKLINRGYDQNFINDIQNSVSYENRQHVLDTTGKKPASDRLSIPLVFITKYTGHIKAKSIKTSLLENWNLIQNNRELNSIFPEPPIIAFKRSTNIQDKIIRSKLPSDGNLEILNELLEDQINT